MQQATGQRSRASSTNEHPAAWMDVPQWFVLAESSDEAVGPVSADQIARGILAGKVPRDAYVACEGDPGWREILDVPEVVGALKALPPS
jgi:hypothetical protein